MKPIKFLNIIAMIFILVSCSNVSSKGYSDYVKDFHELSFDEVNDKIYGKDSFYLYVGKESCPYCEIFVPKLLEASKETNIPIYYWDVEAISDDDQVNNFLKKYQIEYTPTLLKFNTNGAFNNIEFDSEKISSKELQIILKKD